MERQRNTSATQPSVTQIYPCYDNPQTTAQKNVEDQEALNPDLATNNGVGVSTKVRRTAKRDKKCRDAPIWFWKTHPERRTSLLTFANTHFLLRNAHMARQNLHERPQSSRNRDHPSSSTDYANTLNCQTLARILVRKLFDVTHVPHRGK